MADTVRRDRDHTDPYPDPFPLRRVVRQRPLTEEELRAIYGYPYHEETAEQVSPPGVVRPSDWGSPEGSSEWGVASVPQPGRWEPPGSPAVRDADFEDDVRIPMRRSRLGWAVVIAVVASAGGLLAYAIADRSDLLESLNLTGRNVVLVSAGPPVDRNPIELAPLSVKIGSASAEVAVMSEAAQPDAEKVATPARRERTPPLPPPRTEPAPAASPYPDLEQGTSLQQVQQEIDSQLGIAPTQDEPGPTEGLFDEPNDLQGLPEFEQAAPEESEPSGDNPYQSAPEAESEPAPETEPPPDEIVRDPGF
jgi:hypothetical protein